MAYVLGLIFADGAIEDVRISSRTCYIQITSKDKSLLEQVRVAMSSSHTLYIRSAKNTTFHNGTYLCSEIFNLRIGNKIMYQDLIERGLTPRKSLTMLLPNIPTKYFRFFLRGYLDGDGCISVYTKKGGKAKNLQVIFISGSYKFLDQLSKKLHLLIGVARKGIYKNTRSLKISYNKKDSLKLLSFIYTDLEQAPYLERKYNIYKSI